MNIGLRIVEGLSVNDSSISRGINLADDFCWVTCHKAIRWDIFSNYRTRSNHTMVPDRYARHNYRLRTNQTIITNARIGTVKP